MRYLMIVALLVLVFFGLGCATSPGPLPGAGPSTSGRGTGGEADSTGIGVDVNTAFAQPTGRAVASAVKNVDQINNASAGDGPTLVIGGGSSGAVAYLEKKDPILDNLFAQISHWMKALGEEGADQVAINERLDALSMAVTAREHDRVQAAQGIAGSFPQLSQVIYVFQKIVVTGGEVEKIPVEALVALSDTLEHAIQPAVNATEK